MRHLLGQSKSSFDLRSVMDEGHILLANLAKGRLGEDMSALLGALLITGIEIAALSRAEIPEDQRRDFYLYIDEAHTFQTLSLADLLPEARKYVEEALPLARRLEHKAYVVSTLLQLGDLDRLEGELDAAATVYEEGIALARGCGDLRQREIGRASCRERV